MKKLILLIGFAILGFTSCKTDVTPATGQKESNVPVIRLKQWQSLDMI